MYFIDVQGTLISDADKSPLRGSREFIQKLNQERIPYMVITNSTKEDSKDFYAFLCKQGFDFPFSRYL
ncbi:MAG: HAD family hydrolase, partial [Thiovulaceae bacterium]|nr:HAD family hydrolase [Sulfurimonadaceae bacterium]